MSSSQKAIGHGGLHPSHLHTIQLYGADERLLTVNVARYIAEGLQLDEAVLVIASPDHTAAFVRQLPLAGIHPDRAVKEQQLTFLDAKRMLDSFMVDGRPDKQLFRNALGSAVRAMRAAQPGAGKRAYGEMAGTLWARDEFAAAIELEELWNEFVPPLGLQLFCGYPINVFDAEFGSADVHSILRSHSRVRAIDEDGDLERAVQRAIDDFAPPDSDPHSIQTAAVPDDVMVPDAEKAILSLRAGRPGHAKDVLSHARHYYQAEKHFRALIENSSDAILLMNPGWEILYASHSTARVLGYAPARIMGTNCLHLVHPADRDNASRTVADALATPRVPLRFEARVRTNVGDWGWVEITVTDLSLDPSVGGIVWNYRDISERKAAEQALRESERRLATRERYLQTLLDSMPDCVKVLGRHGEVLEMNAAGLRMLEADSPQQVIGQCVYPVIDPSNRGAFQALNESVFDGGTGGTLDFSVNGLKGAHRTFETHVVPLRDGADRVIGALSATRDITEREAAVSALRQANESLEQFGYAAAHDLQEPIRNVSLYTELLARRYRGKLDEQASEFMDITVEGARRMQALVSDLLAYTRSLDKPQNELPGTDANGVVAEVLANLRTAIGTTGAEVVCGNLPSLPIYRVHLVQLLQNLVGNALKYRSEDLPHIEISSLERPEEFVITVRDNGIGIPADQTERIFGVFKRLHGRNVAGNGIGLAICQRIISHYEGRIWVESQPGQGSAFMFTLPCRRPLPTQ